jgi:hypothetical protein
VTRDLDAGDEKRSGESRRRSGAMRFGDVDAPRRVGATEGRAKTKGDARGLRIELRADGRRIRPADEAMHAISRRARF